MVEVHLATLAAEAREAIDSEDFARAADACRRALLRFPRWVEGYWLLGQILVENGYLAQARSCFEAVASAMPDDPRAYEGLAAAAEQQHDLPTAVAGLIRAIEVGESSQGVLDELRRLQEQAAYVHDGTYTAARVAHARLLAGQYEEADAAAERAMQEEPDRLDLLVVQAVARLFSGDRRGSRQGAERLLELSPDCLKALAIMRYLTPGEATAHLTADLDALDPEGQTLVWLRSQVTTLGYEADDLPVAPRLLNWQEDGDAGVITPARPLDRLIPELEAVWPQWLQEAARQGAGEHAEEADVVPPPSIDDGSVTEPEAPSFLGDVDSLAREFEDAMRVSGAAAPPTGEAVGSQGEQPAEGEQSTTPDAVTTGSPSVYSVEQAAAAGAGVTLLDGGSGSNGTADRADGHPAVASRDTAMVETPPAAVDEFAQWRAAPSAEQHVSSDTLAAGGSEQGIVPPDAVDPVAKTEDVTAGGDSAAVSCPASADWTAGATDFGSVLETETKTPAATMDDGWAAGAEPATASGQLDIAGVLQAAQQAARNGDYWAAIFRYGQVLDEWQTAPNTGY